MWTFTCVYAIVGLPTERGGDIMSERELLQMILSETQDVKAGLSEVKTEVNGIRRDMDTLKSDVSELKSDVITLKSDVSELKSDVITLKSDVSELKSDVDDLKVRTALIETTLENVTNRNIKIIAEGHGDLSRKLDHVLQMESEKEMFLIRFNVMESRVEQMKQYFESIA